jgi:hypothetical protein
MNRGKAKINPLGTKFSILNSCSIVLSVSVNMTQKITALHSFPNVKHDERLNKFHKTMSIETPILIALMNCLIKVHYNNTKILDDHEETF